MPLEIPYEISKAERRFVRKDVPREVSFYVYDCLELFFTYRSHLICAVAKASAFKGPHLFSKYIMPR